MNERVLDSATVLSDYYGRRAVCPDCGPADATADGRSGRDRGLANTIFTTNGGMIAMPMVHIC